MSHVQLGRFDTSKGVWNDSLAQSSEPQENSSRLFPERRSMSSTNEPVVGNIDKDKEPQSFLTTLSAWKEALVTKEDLFYHHKILGGLVLLSAFVRFTYFVNDMGFRSHPEWTIPTLALHWMLTASAFQFKIPKQRIRDGGRIWQQYRWHALIFTTRSVLFIALYWYEQQKNLEPDYNINFALAMSVMAAADCATWAAGDDRSNTVRELDGPGMVKFAFSSMQFNVTAFFIVGIRSCAVPFYALVGVQITAFVGTLRRKGVFNSKFWGGFVYGSLLVGGFVVQAYQYHVAGGERMHLFGRAIALLAAFLRLTPLLPSFCWPLQNKFVIWTLVYFIVRHYRPMVSQLDLLHLRCIVFALLMAMVVSCYVKVKSGYYPSDVKAAKQMKTKSL
jgi:hypothetical protein